jgi:RNA polymerase sigma-70 factor, ECF subfamily
MRPLAPAADLDLVRRLLAGDEAAFDTFFSLYFPRLFRFALARLGGDEDRAEEAVQAALAKAVSRLSSYRGEAALATWLTTFCRHELWAVLSARPGLTVGLCEEDGEVRAALETLAAEQDGPEQRAKRRELARRVHAALDWLPPRYAQALGWKYLEELPVATIARRLELSEKAAESLLTRARAAFREAFAQLEPAGGAP